MNLMELILMCVAWIGFIGMFVVMIVLAKFTPAWTFLRAKFGGKPVIATQNRDSFADLQTGDRIHDGRTKVKGYPVSLVEGSHMIERKSKVAMFFRFGNMGINTNMEYPAIIAELAEKGIVIKKFDELDHLVKLTSDEQYRDKYLAEITDEAEREKEKKRIEKIGQLEIDIKPWKSYKLMELQNLFPFNVNSDFIEAITEEEINLAIKKLKKKEALYKLLMVGAIAFAIIVGILLLFFMVVDIPSKEVVCNCGGMIV